MNNLIDILRVGVFAPKPPSPQQWVSESGVKFHLEKPESRTLGRGIFTAICGLNGEMYHERFEGQHTFLRCFDCERIQAQSTVSILDKVADQATDIAPVIDSLQVGGGGEVASPASPLQVLGLSAPALEALNTEEEVSTGSRKRSGCAVHGSVGRPTDFLSLPVPLGREGVSGSTDNRAQPSDPLRSHSEYPGVGAADEERGISDSQILPVHLTGREVSGTVDRHGAERLKATTTSGEPKERSTGSWPSKDECIRMTLASEVTISASPADQIFPEPFTLQRTGATASTSLSVVPENFTHSLLQKDSRPTFIERIDEFVAVRLPRIADCFCGRPSVHECPCGEPICANHSYASLCGTCTEAKQLQQSSVMDGESRY